MVYNFINTTGNLSETQALVKDNERTCNMNVSFQIIIPDIYEKMQPKEKWIIDVSIESEECSMFIKAPIAIEGSFNTLSFTGYAFILIMIASFNLYAVCSMISKLSRDPEEGQKLSLISMCWMVVMDSYVCFTHIFLTILFGNQFVLLFIPSFLYFMLFAIFDIRMLVLIWKSKYLHQFNTQDELRKGLGKFYCKFYGLMIISFYLITG